MNAQARACPSSPRGGLVRPGLGSSSRRIHRASHRRSATRREQLQHVTLRQCVEDVNLLQTTCARTGHETHENTKYTKNSLGKNFLYKNVEILFVVFVLSCVSWMAC